MKPRGRVFYQPADDQYIIAVGSWIDQNPEAIGQIIEEFDLPKAKTIVKKALHRRTDGSTYTITAHLKKVE